MSDWVKVPEADWRVLRSMKGVLFRRLQEKSLGELLEILLRRGNGPGETLAEVSKQARWIDVRAQRVCGKLTRHGCRTQFASMLRLGLFRTEEIEAFTEKTRRWVGLVRGGEEDAAAESPAEPPLPVAQARTADEGKFNGYITPDGECVQLEDLAGMKRALARHFGGDFGRVLHGAGAEARSHSWRLGAGASGSCTATIWESARPTSTCNGGRPGIMKISGADYLQRLLPIGNFTAKMVFNDQGAFIFSAKSQHREMKQHEMHHRAQVMVYQRLLGLVPHLTRERQARMGPLTPRTH